jgi:hypothetical protein
LPTPTSQVSQRGLIAACINLFHVIYIECDVSNSTLKSFFSLILFYPLCVSSFLTSLSD